MTHCPTEHAEQRAVIEWARVQGANTSRYPGLALMHAIPNGGGRSRAEAGMLKAEGVLAGVPDLFLPAPIGPYAGLYVEMKRAKGGRVSPEQRAIIAALKGQGYCVEVCHGADEAINAIIRYYQAGEWEVQPDRSTQPFTEGVR